MMENRNRKKTIKENRNRKKNNYGMHKFRKKD